MEDDYTNTEKLARSLKNRQGQLRRIGADTEAKLQATMHRIAKKEEETGEKQTKYRKSGAGISADAIINQALELMLLQNDNVFGDKLEEHELTEPEKEANTSSYITEGGLILDHANQILAEARTEAKKDDLE